MLHYFLNTYQAIINHIFGTLPQLQDETLDTTTLESSQGWSNYFPEDMINTIKASIENPNPWTLAILSGAACLGSSYYLYKSHQESLMMQEFKDQNDMARLLTFYENQFKTYFTTLGSFNNRIIFKISDTAIFQAIPYVVLNPHENQQDRLSKAIKDWMLEILSFVLLKRINVQELRCFIPINHLNIHWTSLNITINLSEEGQIAFEQIKEKFSTQFSVIDNFQVDYKMLNQIKNFLSTELTVKLYALPLSSVINLVHQDSLNEVHYNQNVQVSLLPFLQENACGYIFQHCQQQEAHTCIEHAARNGIYYGLYQTQPEITDSRKLRQLTNYLKASSEYTLKI